VDTFTGWTPPNPINLVIAVSFGLLVPPRILGHAQYGGLNVHPSLLPDLRGPAPIEHAILKRRSHTGVSVQTLHPQHFDQGTILAQTPAPGVEISQSTTAQELSQQLAQTGANMLVDVLKSRKFVPPFEAAGWYSGPISHAPKITKQDRFIDFSQRTVNDVLAIQHAFRESWCLLPNGDRLILQKVVAIGMVDKLKRPAGLYVEPTIPQPVFIDRRGGMGMVMKSTYSGDRAGRGNDKLKRVLKLERGSNNED
jgi:methionyl-tRNA formyltransferase